MRNRMCFISPLTLLRQLLFHVRLLADLLFSDADLERLYEQWEEDDEPLPVDELPEYDPRRPQPNVDFSKLNPEDPESFIKATKKGKTLMIFVRVSHKVSE